MTAFYISRQGYQEGPHSLELIEDKLEAGYFTPNDYIFDSKANEWVLLSRFKLTQEMCQKKTRQDKEEVTQPMNAVPTLNTWYLLRGENQSGPYEYQELVSMLLEKKAFEYDYVWAPTMAAWERVSECHHFHRDHLTSFLKEKKSAATPAYFRRKVPRVEHGASLVIHNNSKIWNGTSFEVSAAGASVEVVGHLFQQGQILIIHYRPSKKVPAFNVHCEVVSCVEGAMGEHGPRFRMGLRFIKVNKVAQTIIRDLVTQRAA